MENQPYHHRQNSLYLPPPTPPRQGGSLIRHRSLSPSILKPGRDGEGVAASSPGRRSSGPRPAIPSSPSHANARSSPLASRTLSELNISAREENIILSPDPLEYRQPRLLQPPPPEAPSADCSTSICTSTCSAPSSPFMELIYSASASTAETPDIFRQLDEEAKETPVIANPRLRCSDASSKCTTSLQSMIHETESAPRHGIPATWVVPRILHTALGVGEDSFTTNNERSSTSPFSIPSMLGTTQASYDSEDVSDLESPMLFSTVTEASEIQSRSQATDINSLRTTPRHDLQTTGSTANGDDGIHAEPLSRATLATKDEPIPEAAETPGPLVRCDAHDEFDGGDNTESDSTATPYPGVATPSLTQLASSSGFLLSRQEVVEAAYESDSQDILSEDPYIRRLQQQHVRSTQEKTQVNNKQQQKQRWMVNSQLFFQSPQTVQFTDMDEDDGMISELSSHQGDTRDIEQGTKGTYAGPETILPPTTTASSSNGSSSGSHSRYFFARSRLGMICRLFVIVFLALCILAPLAWVLFHSRSQSSARDMTSNGIDNGNIGLTMFPKTPAPTAAPYSAATGTPGETAPAPVPVPESPSYTAIPTVAATQDPTQLVITLEPTVTPTAAPTRAPLASSTALPTTTLQGDQPTLPPYEAIWDEWTWVDKQGVSSSGPLWESSGTQPLELTIVNSLTDPTQSIILDETIQDWAESGLVFEVISDPPATPVMSVEDCIPNSGRIRVCNGNFGDTDTRFFSRIYVNDQQRIVAATILQNDQFGLEMLGVTPELLAYNYCHELGHALGLFHNSQGCMVQHILLDALAEGLFVRPDPSDLEALVAMYGL